MGTYIDMNLHACGPTGLAVGLTNVGHANGTRAIRALRPHQRPIRPIQTAPWRSGSGSPARLHQRRRFGSRTVVRILEARDGAECDAHHTYVIRLHRSEISRPGWWRDVRHEALDRRGT